MQASADGRVPSPSAGWNDGHHSIVSQLVSLIEHVQAGMEKLDVGIRASLSRSRPQAPVSASFDRAPPRFFLFFPFRKETSISAPLTRTSSHRR